MRQATHTTSTDTKEREIIGSDTLEQATEAATREGDQASLHRVVQAKMAVSSPSDSFEIEAERVADAFVSRSYASGHTAEIDDTAGPQISRRAMGDGLQHTDAGLHTSDDTAAAISRASTGGNTLDPHTQQRFEEGLGADLSNVRIHADGQSDTLCRSLSAEAFTTGSDVFFSSGAFQPGTKTGDHLLAHELTHVVQQGSAPVIARSIFGKSDEEKAADARAAKMREDRAASKKAFMDAAVTQEERNEDQAVENASIQAAANEAQDDAVVEGFTDQLKEVVVESVEMDHISQKGEGSNDTKHGAVVGLASATKSLVMSVLSLYKAIKSDEADNADRAEAVAAAVKEALGVAENSLKVATTFGGSVGSAAVPGIGIVISAISAGQEVLNIYRANRDISAMKAQRDASTDDKEKIAIDNLIRRRSRSYLGAIVNLVGDITMLIGNIGVVATGPGAPWALIVVAAGGLIKAFSSIGQAIGRWMEAHYTNKARAEMASAEEEVANAKTDEEKKAANERLEAAKMLSLREDATYAASYILEKAVEMRTEDGQYDPKAVSIISAYGLNEKWMNKYHDSNKSPQVFDEGVDVILAQAGTSRNPRGFIDSLKATGKAILGAFKSFWNWLTGKKAIEGSPEDSPIRIKVKADDELFEALVPTLAKFHAKKPPVAGKINEKFTKIYKALLATFAPANYKDKAKAKYNTEIINGSVRDLILGSEGGENIEAGTFDIRDDKVEFKVKKLAA